jgi:hypothetical protein
MTHSLAFGITPFVPFDGVRFIRPSTTKKPDSNQFPRKWSAPAISQRHFISRFFLTLRRGAKRFLQTWRGLIIQKGLVIGISKHFKEGYRP